MRNHINQLLEKSIQNFQVGNFDEAEFILSQVLNSQPKNFDALHILGVIKGVKKKYPEALEIFKKALKINPNNSVLHFNIGKAFSEIGEHEKALKFHLNTTKLDPNFPDGWLNHGMCLFNLSRLKESVDSFNKALALNPEYVEAWYNRGNVFFSLNQYELALGSYDEVIRIKPDHSEAWYNRGNALSELKEYEAALTSYDKAISTKPDHSEAWYNRGNALLELKQYEPALASYDQVIKIKPDNFEAWYNRGNTLLELTQFEPALASYDKAISIKPDFVQAWSNRGNALAAICQFDLSEASNREAIRIDPDFLIAHSNLLFNFNYLDFSSPQYALNEAKLYGAKVSEKSIPKFTKWDVSLDAKKLRIGFVSGDFVNHPVGYFIEGLLEHLDQLKFEIHAFPTQSFSDDLTNRIKPFFKEWTPILGKSDLDAAALIHQRGIQILIDLSGHTARNRLPIFSFKPAPVQVSWLGYFATTGLPEMDYFMGDPYMSPSSEVNHFSERVWNLAETWFCHKPSELLLSVSELPALGNGFLTFGSLGNLSKMNDQVINTWASVLNRVPGSKLLLKSKQFRDQTQVEAVRKRFEKLNISADRLILEGPDSRKDYFKTYNRIDFVLDTFPYPGGTTSVDALWMGVPVLTLKGDRFLSHLGESIAFNAGLSDWIAQDTDDYVNKAVQFASDIEQLAQLRNSLRQYLQKSPLFDTSRFANNFENALWGMWNQHSKNQTSHE
jgi:protein O-GlcNAc transferase